MLSTAGKFVLEQRPDHVIAYDPHDVIGEQIYLRGDFQRSRTDEVVQFLVGQKLLSRNEPRILVEVGANIGSQTIYLAASKCFSRLLLLEPNPRCFQLLRWNLLLNELMEMAEPLQLGAGDSEGVANLHETEFNLGASRIELSLAGESRGGECLVEVKRLDGLLNSREISENAIGLIWIDVEGFEVRVLRGLGDYLHTNVPIYIEFSPKLLAASEVVQFIKLIKLSRKSIYIHKDSFEIIAFEDLRAFSGQIDLLLI